MNTHREPKKVETEVIDRAFVITINRRHKRNCVDGETADLLSEAWKHFRDDEELWVAILTGVGDEAFCAGADLGALDTLGAGPNPTPSVRRHS